VSKISIQISGKGLIFKKGSGQFTIPLEVADGPLPDKLPKIHYVSDEVAERIRPGITRIRHRGRTGLVSGRPVYKEYLNYGFWYADIRWDDGIGETFNLNKMGIELQV